MHPEDQLPNKVNNSALFIKLPMRTIAAKNGAAIAMLSSVHTIFNLVLRTYSNNAMITPITPPWLAKPENPLNLPSSNGKIMSSGLFKYLSGS